MKKTGDITVYAGDEVLLEPDFTAEYGSTFHAFIAYDGCSNPLMVLNNNGSKSQRKEQQIIRSTSINSLTSNDQTSTASHLQLFPNPNRGEFTVILPNRATSGTVVVNDLYGKTLYTQTLNENRFKIALNLPQDIYFLRYMNNTQVQTLKFVVQ